MEYGILQMNIFLFSENDVFVSGTRHGSCLSRKLWNVRCVCCMRYRRRCRQTDAKPDNLGIRVNAATGVTKPSKVWESLLFSKLIFEQRLRVSVAVPVLLNVRSVKWEWDPRFHSVLFFWRLPHVDLLTSDFSPGKKQLFSLALQRSRKECNGIFEPFPAHRNWGRVPRTPSQT